MTKNNDCQDRHDAIAALVLGELEIPAADEIKKHMDCCRTCRALYEALTEEEEIVRSTFKAIGERSKVIGDNLVAQYGKGSRVSEDIAGALPASQKTKQARAESGRWTTIMKSRISQLAAAAVILIGVLILTRFFVGTDKSVVLAGVLEKVEQVQAYTYKMDITFSERTNPEKPMTQKIEGTIIVSNEYGTKLETYEKWEAGSDTGKITTKIRYTLPKRKLDVLIKPDQKTYKWTELDDDSIPGKKKENDQPREMIKQMMQCEYTKLGRSVINDIEVEGFETTDPKWTMGTTEDYEDVRVNLWVDVETWLPVLWETDTRINEQTSLHTVFSDFQWDIPVVASDFEPVIPADYTDMAADGYEAPSMSK
jgi:outer membrane lipoprotein-sorting protein